MHFTLSRNTLLHTILLDPEAQPLYKITTSNDGRTTSIMRRTTVSSTCQDFAVSDAASEITLINSEWFELAQFCWKSSTFSSTSIEIDDSCFSGKSIKREFVFNSNGHRYKWSLGVLGAGAPILTDDRTVTARLHRARAFPRSAKAYLEVKDESLYALDTIISTLVYVEKRRNVMQEENPSSKFSSYATATYSIYRR